MNEVQIKSRLSFVALLLWLAAGIVHDSVTHSARAAVFILNNVATPTLSIQVGHKNKISQVDFDVKANDVLAGTPVDGKKDVDFTLIIRATAANPLTGFLTVDCATPLSNGSGGFMPTSEISWTSQDGDIPSGSFDGFSTNQPLASFTSSRQIEDRHSFQYKNQNVFDAGTYNGQVTYTWAAP